MVARKATMVGVGDGKVAAAASMLVWMVVAVGPRSPAS
jgi:hypothetical protein